MQQAKRSFIQTLELGGYHNYQLLSRDKMVSQINQHFDWKGSGKILISWWWYIIHSVIYGEGFMEQKQSDNIDKIIPIVLFCHTCNVATMQETFIKVKSRLLHKFKLIYKVLKSS